MAMAHIYLHFQQTHSTINRHLVAKVSLCVIFSPLYLLSWESFIEKKILHSVSEEIYLLLDCKTSRS